MTLCLRGFIFFVSASLRLCGLLFSFQTQAQSTEISLNQDWQFRKAGDSVWYHATVPGTVHTDLLDNHLIPDPFYRDNESKVQWVENEDWEYQTFFNCDQEFLQNKHIELQFDGLDTYADVYLNDSFILSANNMFRLWIVDVKKIIREKNNHLFLHFFSAVKKGKELAAQLDYALPGDEGGKAFERKAQYQFGWDWGPRLVTCGVWKEIRLSAWNEITKHDIEEIEEWRTNRFDSLRTELIQQPDSLGTTFYFQLNGQPLFIKGANIIPPDNFLPRVTTEGYKRIVDDAVECHMNMLRVWGGGAYLPDEFYDYCDEKGILIWQDFMFAGAMVPGDSAFVENVKQEAIQQVTRLRNHLCIALWCGNNEVDEGWHNWGWQFKDALHDGANKELWNSYQTIFDTLLRSIVNEYDPGVAYVSSSPKFGWGHKEAFTEGDSHYWNVWWGRAPFSAYDDHVGRFMSEYGFQGMPSMNTIEEFSVPDDRRNIPDDKADAGEVMTAHNKHGAGYEIINEYMKRDYKIPADFENYDYVSQLVQRDGMKTAIEAHRRAKPYCMGTLYWQLNDCWPVTSWSSRDYFGQWKASQYEVKNDYKTFLLSVKEEDDRFDVYVVSDSLNEVNATLRLKLMDFSGLNLWSKDTLISVKENSSAVVYSISKNNFPKDYFSNNTLFDLQLQNTNEIFCTKHFYFQSQKKLELEKVKPEVHISYTDTSNVHPEFPYTYNISLTADTLMKDVMLDFEYEEVKFSDNFFDLLPSETKTITMYAKNAIDYLHMPLKIISLIDTY